MASTTPKPQGFAPGGNLAPQYHGCLTVLMWTLSRGASNAELKPHKLEGTMAFMFENAIFPQRVTAFAAQSSSLSKGIWRLMVVV